MFASGAEWTLGQWRALAFARLARANLMHRKRIDTLILPNPTPPTKNNQLSLIWPPA